MTDENDVRAWDYQMVRQSGEPRSGKPGDNPAATMTEAMQVDRYRTGTEASNLLTELGLFRIGTITRNGEPWGVRRLVIDYLPRIQHEAQRNALQHFRDRLSGELISYSDGSTMLRAEDFDRIFDEEMGR